MTIALLFAVAQGAGAQTWKEVSSKDDLVSSISTGAYIKLKEDIFNKLKYPAAQRPEAHCQHRRQ